MHEVVRLEEPELVTALPGVLLLGDEGVDAGDVGLRGAGAALDDDLALEALAREAGVLGGAHVDLGDVGAALRDGGDEPLLLEDDERLAHRRAPEAELLADPLGDEALAGLVSREHEGAAQSLVGLRLKRCCLVCRHAVPIARSSRLDV